MTICRHELRSALVSAAMVLMLAVTAWGQTEKILYSFIGSSGLEPNGGLIFDSAGNLYGTTYEGGQGTCSNGCGVVFEVSPSSGGWTERVIHSFSGSDGVQPQAGVAFDTKGNLYGTTPTGGAYGFGTVYELTPANSVWIEHVVYNFIGGSDGGNPVAGVVLDSAGNLYGTTTTGGANAQGGVFELTPISGHWNEQALYSFNNLEGTGASPLVFDATGNLYGTATSGGHNNYQQGTVFELSQTNLGTWEPTVLYAFQGSFRGGSAPNGGVVFDSLGNLYGCTQGGGSRHSTVFELSAPTWKYSQLAEFFTGTFPGGPTGPMTVDSAGNVYGSLPRGGDTGRDAGSVFKVPSGGEYIFGNTPFDGRYPQGGLVLDAQGSAYGTTSGGGRTGQGTVFEVTF